MTYWFAVGQLSCAVVSDGQMEPPLAPPLEAFFTPGTGVPARDLRQALSAEGQGRTMVIPYLMMTRHDIGSGDAFGGWLMPVVPPMVSAATGALLIPHVGSAQGRLALLLACYAMFGISLFASVIISLAARTHLDVLRGASVLLFALLLVAWLVAASRTARGVASGRLFEPIPSAAPAGDLRFEA